MDSLNARLIRSGTLTLFALVFGASIAAGQTPTQTPPPLPTPPPAAKPAVLKPAAPLPADARIAFINLELVFSESEVGKAGQARWRGLTEKLFSTLTAQDKEIQTLADKIKTQQSVADPTLLATWNMDLARMQRQAQFAQQEARAQSEQMQQEVLAEFGKKVQPAIDALRVEKGLHAILSVQSGAGGGLTVISSDPGVDLSAELIKKLNAMK